MARRFAALLAMLAILALAATLLWRVHEHHVASGADREEVAAAERGSGLSQAANFAIGPTQVIEFYC